MRHANNIAIVTTCFENPVQLWGTLKSVTEQTEKPAQHLVVDSSSPVIAEEIEVMANNAGAQYVWTPPQGVYPAMNRALEEIAPGHHVWFVNSSDFLAHPRSVATVSQFMKEHKINDVDWMLGGLFRASRTGLKIHQTGTDAARFSKRMILGAVGFPHPSTLVPSTVLQNSTAFDERLQIAADYDAGLMAIAALGPPAIIDLPLALHFPGGISYLRPVRNYLEKLLSRSWNFSPPQAAWANLVALGYGVRGVLRRLGVIQEPNPPDHFLEIFNDPVFHFCGRIEGQWPSCCLEYLDSEKPQTAQK